MKPAGWPASPLEDLRTVELTPHWEPALQAFFEASPGYFQAVQGEPVQPGQAHDEIHGQPPAGWPFTRKWLIGYADSADRLAALANVVSDLPAPGVWHIGLFMVAQSRHGSGQAQALARGIEAWAAASGASWLRLGVVAANPRAQRFWAGQGFVQVGESLGVVMGRLTQTVRVMMKPLTSADTEAYFTLTERDRPVSWKPASQALEGGAHAG